MLILLCMHHKPRDALTCFARHNLEVVKVHYDLSVTCHKLQHITGFLGTQIWNICLVLGSKTNQLLIFFYKFVYLIFNTVYN